MLNKRQDGVKRCMATLRTIKETRLKAAIVLDKALLPCITFLSSYEIIRLICIYMMKRTKISMEKQATMEIKLGDESKATI